MNFQKMLEDYTGIVETTPTEITDDIRRYAKQRSKGNEPVFVSVLPLDDMVPLDCYGNVERQVRLAEICREIAAEHHMRRSA